MHVKYIWFKVPICGKHRIKFDITSFISTLYLHNGMDTFFEHPIGWKTEDTYTHNKVSNSTTLKQTYKQNTLGLFMQFQLNQCLIMHSVRNFVIKKKFFFQFFILHVHQSFNFSHHKKYSFQFLVNRKII